MHFRRWILLPALAVSLSFAGSTMAHANFFSGNQLLATCEADDPVSQAICMGYMMAANDTARVLQPGVSCESGQVTSGQLVAVFKTALKNHPEVRDKDAALLTYWAFQAAFPCSERAAP